jgi:hypothetical protein
MTFWTKGRRASDGTVNSSPTFQRRPWKRPLSSHSSSCAPYFCSSTSIKRGQSETRMGVTQTEQVVPFRWSLNSEQTEHRNRGGDGSWDSSALSIGLLKWKTVMKDYAEGREYNCFPPSEWRNHQL